MKKHIKIISLHNSEMVQERVEEFCNSSEEILTTHSITWVQSAYRGADWDVVLTAVIEWWEGR